MRLLLVDDHAVVRAGFRRILEAGFSGVEITEATNASEALQQVVQQGFDVIVLDISLKGRNGLEVLKEIRILQPDARVLIMTMHEEDQYALRSYKAGAAGYITKDTAPDELLAAVYKVHSGGKYVSAAMAETLASHLTAEHSAPHEALSDRELQVLAMIAAGKTVKQIGVELSLSEKTISTYRTRILEKLKLKTTAELIRYALQARLGP